MPPGVAPLSLGPRALAKMDSRKTKVANWYLDMSMIRKYLEASGGAPRTYHHTAPISMVYAMREALTLVAEEGLENCHARHKANAEYFWSELERIGLEPFVDPSVCPTSPTCFLFFLSSASHHHRPSAVPPAIGFPPPWPTVCSLLQPFLTSWIALCCPTETRVILSSSPAVPNHGF